MKLIHTFLFLNFAATLALGDTSDCYFRDQEIRRLEKKLSKIASKYNGEYEFEFMNWEIQHWLLDPVNYTYLSGHVPEIQAEVEVVKIRNPDFSCWA